MAKRSDDYFLDGTPARIAECTRMSVCSAEPTGYADIANVVLADVTLTAGDGMGDYTISNGDTSGRKVRVAQQADVPITTDGTATHVVLDDGTNLHITTCPSQALTSGGTVTISAFDTEVADPA